MEQIERMRLYVVESYNSVYSQTLIYNDKCHEISRPNHGTQVILAVIVLLRLMNVVHLVFIHSVTSFPCHFIIQHYHTFVVYTIVITVIKVHFLQYKT